MSTFHGSFVLDALADGTTRVFHREELTFRFPLDLLLEPLLGPWLASDTPQEVARMKTLLEAAPAATGGRG